jgi:hypothetical protein
MSEKSLPGVKETLKVFREQLLEARDISLELLDYLLRSSKRWS